MLLGGSSIFVRTESVPRSYRKAETEKSGSCEFSSRGAVDEAEAEIVVNEGGSDDDDGRDNGDERTEMSGSARFRRFGPRFCWRASEQVSCFPILTHRMQGRSALQAAWAFRQFVHTTLFRFWDAAFELSLGEPIESSPPVPSPTTEAESAIPIPRWPETPPNSGERSPVPVPLLLLLLLPTAPPAPPPIPPPTPRLCWLRFGPNSRTNMCMFGAGFPGLVPEGEN